MSEAIISRRGWGDAGKPTPPELRTETITAIGTTNWRVPNYRNGGIKVLIFGGGVDGGNYGVGNGGAMNNG